MKYSTKIKKLEMKKTFETKRLEALKNMTPERMEQNNICKSRQTDLIENCEHEINMINDSIEFYKNLLNTVGEKIHGFRGF